MPLHLLCVFYTGNATKYGSGCIHPSLGQTIHGGELVEPYTRNYLRQEILRSGEFDVCLFVCLLVGSVFCSLYSLWFLKGRPIWGYSCDFFMKLCTDVPRMRHISVLFTFGRSSSKCKVKTAVVKTFQLQLLGRDLRYLRRIWQSDRRNVHMGVGGGHSGIEVFFWQVSRKLQVFR